MLKDIIILIVLLAQLNFAEEIFSKKFINPNLKNFGLTVNHWNTVSGLPDDKIYDLIEDNEGFLWIATGLGLVRFDGTEFVVYNEEKIDVIKNGVISDLQLDSKGNLFFLNSFNIIKKDVKNHFKKLNISGMNKIIPSEIVIDSAGTIWLGTIGNGLYYINNNKLIHVADSLKLNHQKISELLIDKKGNLWIATGDDGIYLYKSNRVIKHFGKKVLPVLNIRTLYIDNLDNLWIATIKGVYKIENIYQNKNIQLEFITDEIGDCIINDADNNIWLGTKLSGMIVISNNKKYKFDMSNHLTDNNITSACLVDNNIFVGTLKGGINYIKKSPIFFISKKDGLINDYVNSFYELNNGEILVGTLQGIYKLNNSIHSPKLKKLDITKRAHILAIKKSDEGDLLVGTKLDGLYIFKRNKVIHYNKQTGLKSNMIRSIFIDDDNSIWLGTNSGGINIIKDAEIKYLTKDDGLSNNLISFIHKDKLGRYWIGTSGGGVNIIEDGRIKCYNKSNGLNGNIISSIYEDDNGDIWLSVNGGGISLFRNGKIYNIGKNEGLYTNVILNIKKDLYNNYWCSTPNGIFRIKKSSIEKFIAGEKNQIEYIRFDKSDGLLSDKCVGNSSQSVIVTSDGKLLFSTISGIIEVNPSIIVENNDPIKLYVDKILVDNTLIDEDDYKNIPPNPTRIDLFFGAIEFQRQNKISLKAKLENVDREWLDLKSKRNISYTNLDYGSYNFRLQAYKKGTNAKLSELTLTFRIEPYFWQTIAFKIFAYFSIIILLTLITRNYLSRKYKRNLQIIEAKHALENERMRISRDMHDEFGASISKINLLAEIAKQEISNKSKIEKIISEISHSAINLAENMDEIVWAVNPRNDRLDKMLYYLTNYFENHIANTNIDFKYYIPDEIPGEFISANVRHNIYCVLREGITNTIKHSGASLIELIFAYQSPLLNIKLIDNGKGIDEGSISMYRNGIKNMRSRINSLGGKIEIKNAEKGGVMIEIVIDINMTQK